MMIRVLTTTLALIFSSSVHAQIWLESTTKHAFDMLQGLNAPVVSTCPRPQQFPASEKIGLDISNREFINTAEFTTSETSYTHQARLSILDLTSGEIAKEEVLAEINKVAMTYAQCGIKLSQIEFIQAKPPANDHVLNRDEGDDVLISQLTREVMRPLIVLSREHEFEERGHAYNRRNAAPPLQDTVFISKRALKADDAFPPTYSTTAHELAHLFCDCSEVNSDQPNILSEQQEFLSHHITPEQCEIFKLSPLIDEI